MMAAVEEASSHLYNKYIHGQKAFYLLYSISKEYNLEIATKKTKIFGFVGADHLRTKIIINNETLEQVSQFTYVFRLQYVSPIFQ